MKFGRGSAGLKKAHRCWDGTPAMSAPGFQYKKAVICAFASPLDTADHNQAIGSQMTTARTDETK